jgi:hypothetical protein
MNSLVGRSCRFSAAVIFKIIGSFVELPGFILRDRQLTCGLDRKFIEPNCVWSRKLDFAQAVEDGIGNGDDRGEGEEAEDLFACGCLVCVREENPVGDAKRAP